MTAEHLANHLADKAACFPETHNGVQTATVTLRDGRTVTGVELAGGQEVIRVRGHYGIPFEAADVVDVDDASALG